CWERPGSRSRPPRRPIAELRLLVEDPEALAGEAARRAAPDPLVVLGHHHALDPAVAHVDEYRHRRTDAQLGRPAHAWEQVGPLLRSLAHRTFLPVPVPAAPPPAGGPGHG